MDENYWSKISNGRVTRRRALVATAGMSAAAAFLAACGGSDSGSSSGPAEDKSSSLVTKLVENTASAKRGGTIKDRTFGDVSTLDPFTANNTLNAVVGLSYSSFFGFKPGVGKAGTGELIGETIESWETSPDGLTVTMKLRQGMKWHNKTPVNGRTVDVEDMLFSWDRFARKGSARAGIANSADPSAPVLSMTSTDAKTIVMKLNKPIVHALGLFASNFTGAIVVLPKETDTSFDPRNDLIGTGPWMMSSYRPSVGFSFKRHPDYWDKDYALADAIEMPIVAEYSAALSQFKAGNIYSFGSYSSVPLINSEDVLSVKREEPRILIYQNDLATAGLIGAKMSFGWLPEKSPFRDERVRQAISRSWDRDLYLDTFYNISKFASQGLPVNSRWHSHLAANWENWWLDPQGKDFGPNAVNFKRDIAEAKKLLSAAGFANGFETTSSYVTTPELGTTAKHAEVIDNFVRDIGINSKAKPLQYANEYIPNYRDGHGQYEGWTYVSTAGAPTGGEALVTFANEYWSKGGSAFHGFSAGPANDQKGDPAIDALIEKGLIERDVEKRRGILNDLQRMVAKPWYASSLPGMATGFTVAWPALQNFRVYQGGGESYRVRPAYKHWLDDTKAPLKG